MRKGVKIGLLSLALAGTVLGSAVATFASTYINHAADSKNYVISGLDQSKANIQDLYAYFDKTSGQTVETDEGNDSKTSFTLTGTPLELLSVSVNGSLTLAYTLSNSTITFNSAPGDGSLIVFTYRVQAGVSAHPYLISNSVHLRNLSKLQNAGVLPDGTYFALSSSFEYGGVDGSSNPLTLDPIGDATNPFKGVFDGKGKTITNLKIKGTGSYVGMFGVIDGGTVRNLILASPDLNAADETSSSAKIGFVCGKLKSGTLSHIGVYGGNGTEHIAKATMTLVSGTKKTIRYLLGEGTIPTDVVFIDRLPAMKAGHIYCDISGVASGWDSTVYAYAWNNAEPSKRNGSWPGVAMTLDSIGVYRVAVADTYDRIIFSYGYNGSAVTRQTQDLTIDWDTPYCLLTGAGTAGADATWAISSWPSDGSTSTQTDVTATSLSIYRDGSGVHVS